MPSCHTVCLFELSCKCALKSKDLIFCMPSKMKNNCKLKTCACVVRACVVHACMIACDFALK